MKNVNEMSQMEWLKHNFEETVETDLVEFWKAKANLYSTPKCNLTDDDTISDYVWNKYKGDMSNTEWEKMNRLIIANWFIQQKASTPLEYKIIEYRNIFKETENETDRN